MVGHDEWLLNGNALCSGYQCANELSRAALSIEVYVAHNVLAKRQNFFQKY